MTKDIGTKRNLLATVKMRFSPESQRIKEEVIDRIVTQTMMLMAADELETVQQLQKAISQENGFHIASNDLDSAFERLTARGEAVAEEEKGVKRFGAHKKYCYRLSEQTRAKIGELESLAEDRLNKVVEKLFCNAKEGTAVYSNIFLSFLASIFTKLADESVQVLVGNAAAEEPFSRCFSSALSAVEPDLRKLDLELFKEAVSSFFRDRDPDYDALKWNMTQNYYIMEVLGLDPSGSLLTGQLFSGALFYLDTNVVIDALGARQDHHLAFKAVHKACENLGINMSVTQITLTEMQRLVEHHRDLLSSVIEQIPKDTAKKIRSGIFEIRYGETEQGEEFNLDRVFKYYDSPAEKLLNDFGVQVDSASWLNENADCPETIEFCEIVQDKWRTQRPNEKKDKAGIHDAVCLRYMEHLRKEGNANVWFVTRDATLPGCVPQKCCYKSLAITMSALLQWIAPIAISESEEGDIATVYAYLIESRVLPQENILRLEDFLMFRAINMSCRELPSEDVEQCIRCIKAKAPMLDLSNADDRETLAYEMAKYFADPGRKYKQELARLEAMLENKDQELERKSRELEGNYISLSNLSKK
jgi:predicted nucleic acid-binding protein